MNIYEQYKTIKAIIEENDKFIAEKIKSLPTETNAEVRAYILGSIEGLRHAKSCFIAAGLTREPPKTICQKHNQAYEELWANEFNCSKCHYESFHYGQEGLAF